MSDPEGDNLRETEAFVVRIWPEAQDDQGEIRTWRGFIDHVGRNRRLYFEDLQGIVRFIQDQTGVGANRRRSLWHTLVARTRHGNTRAKPVD